ncbi:hypothetical protein T05_2479 [Trichinella murrelli]|uniref:Integrase zinc-binding domain-containing protein n=1 Tax=Trichinella murrelli TaxID=144512 RepID=A0A0V0U761_9BILA|nr:hypothetical protein T05_2479 [Trichinella murrelli]
MRKEIRRLELHVFGDASKLAYGAAVYLDGKRTVNLVLAKAKVAPLKQVTLPRLELMAAFTAAKLIPFVKNILGIRRNPFVLDKEFNIKAETIQNRVEIIRQLTSPVLWRHCPTKNNPADLLSRGSTINLKIDEYYPSSVAVLVNVEEDIKLNPERFDDFEKLIRTFPGKLQTPRIQSLIGTSDFKNYWIRKDQRECFANEIQQLLNLKRITSNNLLIHLNLFLDENGLMRINGRLQNSILPETTKHPLILPDKHPLTSAIIIRCHLKQLHSGIDTALTMLRQRFWILRGRRNVKGMIKKCPCCRRVGSKPFVLKMAPLPADRIQPLMCRINNYRFLPSFDHGRNTTQPTRPFENTGLDVASPLLTRSGKTVKKSYPHIYQHDHPSSTPGSCIRHDSSQSDGSDTSIYSPTWQP